MSIETKLTKGLAAANLVVGAAATGVGGGLVYSSIPSEPQPHVQQVTLVEPSKTQASASAPSTEEDENSKIRKAGFGQLAAGAGFTAVAGLMYRHARRREEEEEKNKGAARE